jgi:hypothetical protein
MRPLRATAALVLSAAALGTAGCGDNPGTPSDPATVRSLVTRFAAAGDASACDMLTGNALKNLYGRFNSPIPKAKANCVKRSAKFSGEPIEITKVEIIDDVTAKVNALGKGGTFTYGVTLRKGKRWLIDEINQYKVR